MRWIFVALILLNGVYLGWEVWRRSVPQPVEQSAKVIPPIQGQQLVLLTERLPGARSAVPPPSLGTPARAESVAPAVSASSPAIAARPSPPPSANAPAPVEPRPAPAKEMLCYSIGPIPSRDTAHAIRQQLQEVAVESRMQDTGTDKAARHWVILPPQPDRQKALQVLRELQTRKIDSFLISTGELNNAISLGLFSREALAAGVRDKVREAGYPAEIRLKEPSESQFWLRLRPGQPVEKIEKLLQPTLADKSGIKISNTACEMFAQAK